MGPAPQTHLSALAEKHDVERTKPAAGEHRQQSLCCDVYRKQCQCQRVQFVLSTAFLSDSINVKKFATAVNLMMHL